MTTIDRAESAMGHRVRALRDERGIGQADLAAALTALGLPTSARVLCDVEKGRRGLRAIEVVTIARALNITIAAFFDGIDRSSARASRDRSGAGAR